MKCKKKQSQPYGHAIIETECNKIMRNYHRNQSYSNRIMKCKQKKTQPHDHAIIEN